MALPSPQHAQPPVFYKFSGKHRRWFFGFDEKATLDDSTRPAKWSRSDYIESRISTLSNAELLGVRRQWPQRDVIFKTNPSTGLPNTNELFPALGDEQPSPAAAKRPPEVQQWIDRNAKAFVPALRDVLYRRNAKSAAVPFWEYSMDNGESYLPSWNLRDTGIPLNETDMAELRDYWRRLSPAEFIFRPRIKIPVRSGCYYRFNNGRWEYFSTLVQTDEGGAWKPSCIYEKHGPTSSHLVAKGGGLITTINGRTFRPNENTAAPVSPLSYPQINMPKAGFETSTGRIGSREAFSLNSEIAAAPEGATAYGDSVLAVTEKARIERKNRRRTAIPTEREWLTADGDLIDLSLISDAYLGNIVNLVLRGARVTGQAINRTPERVRQGLNAANEQARRLTVFSANIADLHSTLGKINGLLLAERVLNDKGGKR